MGQKFEEYYCLPWYFLFFTVLCQHGLAIWGFIDNDLNGKMLVIFGPLGINFVFLVYLLVSKKYKLNTETVPLQKLSPSIQIYGANFVDDYDDGIR